jgi:hypothetical protein
VEVISAKLRPDESDVVEVGPAVSEFERGMWSRGGNVKWGGGYRT